MLVLVFHAGLFWLDAHRQGWGALFGRGEIADFAALTARLGFYGVDLFLVLSGFCLRVAWRESTPWTRFVRDRALRLFPPYLASLLLLAWLSRGDGWTRWTFAPIEPWDLAIHAAMLHNLHGDHIFSVNGAYWSLALEWQLYSLFPFTLRRLRRVGPKRLLAEAALVALAVPWCVVLVVGEAQLTGGWWGVVFNSVPARWFQFVMGLVVADAHLAGALPLRRAWLAAAGPLVIPVGALVHEVRWLPAGLDTLAAGACFGSLTAAAAELRATWWARAAAWIGTVSYSLYLLHQPLLLAVARSVPPPSGSPWVLAALLLCPLLPAAYVFHRMTERPFLRGGRFRRCLRMEAPGKPAPATPPSAPRAGEP